MAREKARKYCGKTTLYLHLREFRFIYIFRLHVRVFYAVASRKLWAFISCDFTNIFFLTFISLSYYYKYMRMILCIFILVSLYANIVYVYIIALILIISLESQFDMRSIIFILFRIRINERWLFQFFLLL